MKKTLMTVIALILCISLLIVPVQVAAAPQDENKTVYVSEVKVGMGETSEEASKELLAEGYTILKESDGSYADLNYEAGTKSGLKDGPTQKIVYIGYKTTTNPKEAITDLAVMNMNGGYSIQDYKVLMANHLEGEIKPFVNRFIAALKEYRENYNKPADSLGHIRADYYRQMLNKLTDDDTGGKPLGDLLLNETKYEMGDNKYNALSNAEKKNHADILTLLMQGNGRAILLMEMLIAKAADSADTSWFDRFLETDLDGLSANIKKENPSLTTKADVDAELDKKYNDTAMALLAKWDGFSEMIARYDDNVNAVTNADITAPKELTDAAEALDAENPSEKDAETVANVMGKQAELLSSYSKTQEIAVVDFLDMTDYEDGTLRDFFERDKRDFSGSGIRALYPMAAALSKGQVAGLDFLSIHDLFAIAITDAEGYGKIDFSDMKPASVYQDVDRDIYEPGGVALTNAALRAEAANSENDGDFMLSPLGFVYWGLTAISLAATITSFSLKGYFYAKSIAVKAPDLTTLAQTTRTDFINPAQTYLNQIEAAGTYADMPYVLKALKQSAADMAEDTVEATVNEASTEYLNQVNGLATKSKIAMALGVAFTVITAALAAWSIYTTVTEMMDYYKVTFLPIPRYIVDEADITDDVNGEKIVIKNDTAYYRVVSCNRREGSSDVEKDNYRVLGTANDLNGDVGKQWLALYSVKYEYGSPILADSLMVQKGSSNLPKGYETGIHRFGEGAAFNLTSKYYCYNDTPKGTYVFFKNAEKTVEALTMKADTTADKTKTEKTTADSKSEETAAGSMFSAGTLAMVAGLGMLLGAGIAALIILPIMKKKEKTDKE